MVVNGEFGNYLSMITLDGSLKIGEHYQFGDFEKKKLEKQRQFLHINMVVTLLMPICYVFFLLCSPIFLLTRPL